jgi:hypothetical protein
VLDTVRTEEDAMLSNAEILKVALNVENQRPQIEAMTSYADAFTAAVCKKVHTIDGFTFKHVVTQPTDYVRTGRHTQIYELDGTGKRYRIMIEPMLETHGGRS